MNEKKKKGENTKSIGGEKKENDEQNKDKFVCICESVRQATSSK
jgi:hypothetical protein